MHVRARLLVLAVSFLLPTLADAQASAAAGNAPAPAQAAPAAGPTLDAAVAAFRVPSAATDSATSLLQQRQSMGRPVALMVVGGAAILVGAVIGDAPGTLFMIGGAIALLYGLYQYLQ
ncbi:MAG TPA: hypothetical protein VEB19_07050 [Gemmatimonadaceae bacterium]|nr:hypothetical protein [Gemmatimonadaceae bacterium]